MIPEAEIEALRERADQLRESDPGLAALESRAEVLGYVIAEARARGEDEARECELVLRAADDVDAIAAELDDLVAIAKPDDPVERKALKWRIASCRNRLDAAIGYRERNLREAERIMRGLRYTKVADMIAGLIAEASSKKCTL
jgi:hypothetical protein